MFLTTVVIVGTFRIDGAVGPFELCVQWFFQIGCNADLWACSRGKHPVWVSVAMF